MMQTKITNYYDTKTKNRAPTDAPFLFDDANSLHHAQNFASSVAYFLNQTGATNNSRQAYGA
jgi:hypothetical protein